MSLPDKNYVGAEAEHLVYLLFKLSHHKETLIIIPTHQVESLVYRASSLWKAFRTLLEGKEIKDFTVEISYLID